MSARNGKSRTGAAQQAGKRQRDDLCPCGSGKSYKECCGPYHGLMYWPEDAETLVRARFSAYCLQNWDFLKGTEYYDEVPGENTYACEDMEKEAREEGRTWSSLRILESGRDKDSAYEYVRYEYTLMDPKTGVEYWEQKDYLTTIDGKIYYTTGTDFIEREAPRSESDFLRPADDDKCPCGSGKKYGKCCGPYLDGLRWPRDAKTLVRARFVAYRLQDWDFLNTTEHLDENPGETTYSLADLQEASASGCTWSGLRILDGGRDDDGYEFVEYEYKTEEPDEGERRVEQRDYFATIDGKVYYTTGKDLIDSEYLDDTGGDADALKTSHTPFEKPDPDACPCSSGKKYDECCGPYLEGKNWPEDVETMVRTRYTACVHRDREYLDKTARLYTPEEEHFSTQYLQQYLDDPQMHFFTFILYNKGVDSEGREFADWKALAVRSEDVKAGQWVERSLCERIDGKLYYVDSSATPRSEYRIAQRGYPCPCSSMEPYEKCCAPYLEGKLWPEDAKTMARTRFCALACNNWEYLERTALPREGRIFFRPEELNALADACDIAWGSMDSLERGEKDGEEYLENLYFGEMLDGDIQLETRCYYRRVDGKIYYTGSESEDILSEGRDILCPCKTGRYFDDDWRYYQECCAPYHDGSRLPEDALTFMRTRISAMKLGRRDYLERTSRLKYGEDPLSCDMLIMLYRMGLILSDLKQYSQGTDEQGRNYIDGTVCWLDCEATYPHVARYYYETEDGRFFYTGMRELTWEEAAEAGDFAFPCPCGSGQTYGECCARYITGAEEPEDAVSFVRARCCAFAMAVLPDFPQLEPEMLDFDEDDRRNPNLRDILQEFSTDYTDIHVKQMVILGRGREDLGDSQLDLAALDLGLEHMEYVDYQLDCTAVYEWQPYDEDGADDDEYDEKYDVQEHRILERALFVSFEGKLIYLGGVPLSARPVRRAPKVGRNDPCPCGSGKKYKKCCGKNV